MEMRVSYLHQISLQLEYKVCSRQEWSNRNCELTAFPVKSVISKCLFIQSKSTGGWLVSMVSLVLTGADQAAGRQALKFLIFEQKGRLPLNYMSPWVELYYTHAFFFSVMGSGRGWDTKEPNPHWICTVLQRTDHLLKIQMPQWEQGAWKEPDADSSSGLDLAQILSTNSKQHVWKGFGWNNF